MTWYTTGDIEEFLATAGGFLRADPVRNTVPLTVLEGLRARGGTGALFGWWRPDGGPVGAAFLRTPPHPLLLPDAPPGAVAALAQTLAACDPALPAVNAGPGTAEAFADAWCRLRGTGAAVARRTRLHRLAELVPPHPPAPGTARVATAADRELLLRWFGEFGQEIGEEGHGFADVVDDCLTFGGLTLWEVDGVPVSMAGRTRDVAGVVRVAPVYTPVALRRQGYAGAVTVAVSRSALDAGAADLVLFTDLANPTSNALYQRLGYRPLEDRVVLSFGG